ncbi:hypothetical protein B5F53_11725 [Blautia sp. An249]|uniref:hypothetical protein n=1 Tax=Blautia sp. An249 TaxID=1965603 RepID=UPI000B373F9D|nr:hypothetical protein [Blautia sp. An249]OUO78210.1 hypothetical protein B5F53_11725 [Blautia sp. An249]
MWFIFLVSCIAVALAALLVIWIGSKVLRSIEKQDKTSDVEDVVYDQVKKKIKEEMEKDE